MFFRLYGSSSDTKLDFKNQLFEDKNKNWSKEIIFTVLVPHKAVFRIRIFISDLNLCPHPLQEKDLLTDKN